MPKLSAKPSKFFLRLFVSVVLIVVIYSTANLPSLWQTLKTISWKTVLAVALLYTFGQVVSTWKWSFINRGVGIERSFPSTLKAYFFGMFVNTFGLGTVGGDVARSLALRPAKGKRAAALATVVADRAQGLLVLATIGAVAILLARPAVLEPLGVMLAVPAVLVLALGWWLGPKFLTKIFPSEHRFGHAAVQVSLAFPTNFAPLMTITLISAFFHCVQIYMHYVISEDLNAGLSLAYLFATVPLVNIAASAPISMNGLGIREFMYVFLFVPIGVEKETALVFGAIWILSVTAVSAIGGVLVGAGSSFKVEDAEEENSTPVKSEEEISVKQQAQNP